ncbi:branched-chain amino acid ABC transporter permease [Aquibacillus saliphilus]|uniref:branched-chain amino acid ABC transporter permease n=1 Tax=Aquibacillus saliphilus TaxID=1909422 RepID=UPI001CEFFFBF|nr:branched-chain amino acid ABC transporter permease [Aquibacillus saliphilus]
MDTFLQLIIAGVSTGSIYGLVALAFLIIYNTTSIVNFAQGEFVMVGAMMAFFGVALSEFGYISTFLIIVGSMFVLAQLFKFILVSPLQKRGSSIFHIIIGTIAFGTVLTEGMGLLLGKQIYGVRPLMGREPLYFGNLSILPENLTTIVVSFVLVLVVWYFFHYTMTGKSLRAVGINPEGAQVSGINVARMTIIGFTLSALVSGIGGMMIAPISGASPYIGLPIAVKGFAAAILGGMGNIYAGMIGGLIIGVAESFANYYISSYAQAIAYGIMLLMLFVKPTGLFPEKS